MKILIIFLSVFVLLTYINLLPAYAIGGPVPNPGKGKNVVVNVQCNCINPGLAGDGNNKMNCAEPKNWPNGYKGGPPGDSNQTPQPWKNYLFFCGGGVACENQAGNKAASSTINVRQNGNTGFFSTVPGWLIINLIGVNCTGTIVLPNPPSPPCKQWSNGQCKSVGTALGGLATDPTGFIKSIFDVLLSLSGGIAVLLIIKSGYQLMTSQGKPEQVQNGRDQLIAAIVGLAFLIFSFVILQVVGFDVLKIPGFGQ